VASTHVYVEGRGVVPRGAVLVESAPPGLPPEVTEIVKRHQARGLTGDALLDAIDRHERIVRGNDPDFARELRRNARTLALIALGGA